MNKERLIATIRQLVYTLGKLRAGIDFLYEHRIWEGFWKYGWVVRFLVIAGLLVSYKLLKIIYHGWQHLDVSGPQAMLSSMGSAMSTVATEGYQFLYNGSMKYILLIFMEIIIFHVCRRTIAILAGEDSETSFSAFVQAQKRMFMVVVRVYFLEMLTVALVKAFFWALGPLEYVQQVIVFGVQCYFLGFAVLDNYHEQFGLTIKESVEYGKNFIGVSLGVGFFLQLAFYIPLFGAVAGPLIAAVVVSLVMYDLSDLHLKRSAVATAVNKQDDVV